MFCKNCGTELKDNAKFCHHCGNSMNPIDKEVTPIYCRNCGKKLSDDAKFCADCGTTVNKNSQNNCSMSISDGNRFASSSIKWAILGMITCCMCFVFAPISIYQGKLAIDKKADNIGLAYAGIIISAIELLFWGLFCIISWFSKS